MSKIETLDSIASSYDATQKINDNFSDIEEALQNTLSRDGSTPNHMEATLDMNHNRVENVGEPIDPNDAARIGDVQDLILGNDNTGLGALLALSSGASLVGHDGSTVADVLDDLLAGAGASTVPEVNVLDHGAVADGTTDDTPAFLAAIAAIHADSDGLGGVLRIPAGHYRLTQRLEFKNPIRIIGDGIGNNPGIIDGVSYYTPRRNMYHGTVLVFDDNVAGLRFFPHTTETDPAVVQADLIANGNASTYWDERSAFRSSIENLIVMSAGYTGSTRTYSSGKIGVHASTTIYAENVWVVGFQDKGWYISASPTNSAGYESDYGNADMSRLTSCHAIKCGDDGFALKGVDAQVCLLQGCDSSFNGGWGFDDHGFLGNTYIACHAQSNNQSLRANADAQIGSFRCDAANGMSVYLGCYIENPTVGEITDLNENCIVIGGVMSFSRYYNEVTNKAQVIGAGFGLGVNGMYNKRGDVNVRAGMGVDPNLTNVNTAFWFGSEEESAGGADWRFHYQNTGNQWALEYAGIGTTGMPYQLGTSSSLWRTGQSYVAPAFPNGFFMGPSGVGPYVTYGTTAPASGFRNVGDIHWKSDPVAGGSPGWVCTTAGAPGTWKAMANLAA